MQVLGVLAACMFLLGLPRTVRTSVGGFSALYALWRPSEALAVTEQGLSGGV